MERFFFFLKKIFQNNKNNLKRNFKLKNLKRKIFTNNKINLEKNFKKRILLNLLRNLENRFEKEYKLGILKEKYFQIVLNLKYQKFSNLFKILKFLNYFRAKYDF